MYLKSKLATSKSAYKARLRSTGGTPPSDYSLSYRSPLISPGWSDEDEEEQEEEVDDVTELRQLRKGYPLVRSPKEKVSNVVQSVGDRINMKKIGTSKKKFPTLPTLKKKHRGGNKAGNYHHTAMYHSDYSVDVDGDELESRDDDDDSEYLLRDVYEQSPSKLNNDAEGRAVENGGYGDTRCAQTDEYELSETTQQFYNVLKYKQLQMKDMEEEDRGCLEVVDFGGFEEEDKEESNSDSCGEKDEVNSSSSDKENSTQVKHTEYEEGTNGDKQLLKKELSDSLVGLKLADSDNTATQRGSLGRHDTANSSFFRYSTVSPETIYPPEEEVSDAIDLDSHLTCEEKLLGVPKLSPVDEVDTPVESSVAAMTKESSSACDQQSHVTYASYLPSNSTSNKPRVMVTPTSNGDVIVMTPMEDILDVGLQQQSQDVEKNENKNKLMIPSLGKDGEENERKVDATQIESIYTRCSFNNIRSRANSNEASPTGVDELLTECSEEGAFTKIHKREDSDAFIPSEGWDDDDDEESTTNNSTGQQQPFGSFERYDDALQNIFNGKAQPEVIELRPSLESDCGQSSSVVSVTSSSAMQTSNVDDQLLEVVKEEQDVTSSSQHRNLLDVAVDEDGEQSKGSSKETCASSLGSFSQIYTRTRDLLNEAEEEEEEDDDSESEESDAPGDYFDTGYARAASSDDSGETPDFIKELDQQRKDDKMMTRSNSSSRPWAKLDDSFDSGCEHYESDLISAPSQSMTSNGSQEEEDEGEGGEHLASSPSDLVSPPTVPHILSGGDVEGGTSLVEGRNSRSTNDSMKDFDNLNNYWVHEWSAMATAKKSTSFESIETVDSVVKELANPDSGQQPRFLLRKDVGNSMDDDDEDVNNANKKQDGKDQQATTGKIPAESNICTDCDGNQYLKIYDLDSGRDIYEVIEHGHSLETVEEVEEEEDEEASVKEKSEKERQTVVGNVSKAMDRSIVGSHHKQQQSIASLEDLHSLFDEYQAKLLSPVSPVESDHDAHSTQTQHSAATPQTSTQPAPSKTKNLQFRRVKSSKKRHVHVKKRAIVKAQKNRTKYDLAYLENGSSRDENKVSHRRKMSKDSIELVRVQSQDSHPKSALSSSVVNDTNNVFKALGSLLERESKDTSNVEQTHKEFEDDESSVESVTPKDFEQFLSSYETTMEKSPMQQDKDHVLSVSSTAKTDENQLFVPTLEEMSPGSKNEGSSDHSSAPSSISIDTFASETKEGGGEEEDVVRELPAIHGNKNNNSSSQHGEMKRGQSFILAKLYDENLELIESLAAAQSELEKVNRKLDEVTHERDELIATSTCEI